MLKNRRNNSKKAFSNIRKLKVSIEIILFKRIRIGETDVQLENDFFMRRLVIITKE